MRMMKMMRRRMMTTKERMMMTKRLNRVPKVSKKLESFVVMKMMVKATMKLEEKS